MPTPTDPEGILASITKLSTTPLSILRLSSSITSSSTDAGSKSRTSDASVSDPDAGVTPSGLEADLSHYRELFAKLRFSYVEQVTKEKFIRAIVGDPPLIVSPHDNVELERENLAAKQALKRQKVEAQGMVAELERKGRELARRYDGVRLQTVQLQELPDKIAGLEEKIGELRAAQDDVDNGGSRRDPNLSLPLARTVEVVEERKAQRCEVERELDQLRAKVPRKRKELERLENELQGLEAKRANSTAAAKEARRRKENALGGVEDDLEERARWWRASESVLKQALDIQG